LRLTLFFRNVVVVARWQRQRWCCASRAHDSLLRDGGGIVMISSVQPFSVVRVFCASVDDNSGSSWRVLRWRGVLGGLAWLAARGMAWFVVQRGSSVPAAALVAALRATRTWLAAATAAAIMCSPAWRQVCSRSVVAAVRAWLPVNLPLLSGQNCQRVARALLVPSPMMVSAAFWRC